jgi:uncharacterized protein
MKLDIVSIIKDIGASLEFTGSEMIDSLKDGIGTIEFTTPVAFEGKVTSLNGMVMLEGQVSVKYRTVCDRCGEPVESSLSVPVKEDIIEVKDPEQAVVQDIDKERFSFSGHILELDGILTDVVLLNLPMQHLCREDCPGSLSEWSTAGQSDGLTEDGSTDPRLESLKDFFKD